MIANVPLPHFFLGFAVFAILLVAIVISIVLKRKDEYSTERVRGSAKGLAMMLGLVVFVFLLGMVAGIVMEATEPETPSTVSNEWETTEESTIFLRKGEMIVCLKFMSNLA